MDFSTLPQALRALILPGRESSNTVSSGRDFAAQIKSVPDAVLTQMKQSAQEVRVQGRVESKTQHASTQDKNAHNKSELLLRTAQGDIRIIVDQKTALLFKTADTVTLKLPVLPNNASGQAALQGQNAALTLNTSAAPARAIGTPLNVNVINSLQNLSGQNLSGQTQTQNAQGQNAQVLNTALKTLSAQPIRLLPVHHEELPHLRQTLLSQNTINARMNTVASGVRPAMAAPQVTPTTPIMTNIPNSSAPPVSNTGSQSLQPPSPQIASIPQTSLQALPAPTATLQNMPQPATTAITSTATPTPSTPPQAVSIQSAQPAATIITTAATTITGQAPQTLAPQAPALQTSPSNITTIPNGQAGTLQATVKAYTPAHQPVLHIQSATASTTQPSSFSFAASSNISMTPATPLTSASGLMVLPISGEVLPIGTQLSLRPISLSALPNMMSATPTLSSNASPLSLLTPQLWPTLDQAFQALGQIAPGTAKAMSAMIPNSNSPQNIMPATLFFIAAMRGGDMSSWFGDKATNALKQAGRGNLLDALGRETSAASRLSSDGALQDFKALTLPFMQDGQVHKIALYYKNADDNKDGNGSNGSQTRFIFDLAMSTMGKVQIDGLFGTQNENQPKLDLILRTADSPAPTMRETMRARFSSVLEASGLTGSLSFQNSQESFFEPTPTAEFLNIDTLSS
jgi:hypothetical protein